MIRGIFPSICKAKGCNSQKGNQVCLHNSLISQTHSHLLIKVNILANLFKLNTPVQTEATPVSKKFTVLQNEKYYGIGANKTDRYDQNNTTIDSSFSFFKSQEKSTEGFKEFLASVRAERPKNPRSRGNIVSSSLEVPKTDLSVNSSKPDNLRTMRRPAKGFYRSLIRPDDQMKPKVRRYCLF